MKEAMIDRSEFRASATDASTPDRTEAARAGLLQKLLGPARPLAFDATMLMFRLAIGAGLIYHGWGKVFGGMERFTGSVGKMGFPLPELFAWAGALSELAGGALIALGLGTRIVAIFAAVTLGVAAFIRHGADPFQKKELAILYMVNAMAIGMLGPGRFSLDHLIASRKKSV